VIGPGDLKGLGSGSAAWECDERVEGYFGRRIREGWRHEACGTFSYFVIFGGAGCGKVGSLKRGGGMMVM